jgi:hypothetical protein
MKKIFCSVVLCSALFGVNAAQSAVLTFDDLPGDTSAVTNGYGGFNWNGATQIGSISDSFHPGSGYDLGTVSPNNTVYNYYGYTPTYIDWAGAGTFDFNGAYWTSAWDSAQTLTFEGWNDGSLLYSSNAFAINNQSPLWIALNWTGIDHLVINNSGSHWAMDNFTFNENVNAVPVPAAVWLFGSGLMGLMGFNRKRARSLAA